MSPWIVRMGEMDLRLYRAMALSRTPLLTRFMRGYTHLGDPVAVVIISLLLLSGVLPLDPAVAMRAVMGNLVAFVLSQLLKRGIRRPRPTLPVGFHSVIDAPDRFSFPSGHATASLALTIPPALVLPFPTELVLLAAGLLVGVSRCYLGVHYPGDVLAGWGLAIFASLAVLILG